MVMSRKPVSEYMVKSLLFYHLFWNFGCDQPHSLQDPKKFYRRKGLGSSYLLEPQALLKGF